MTGEYHQYRSQYPVQQAERNILWIGPKEGRYKFEVRQDELRDRFPHFHITNKVTKNSISMSIDTFEALAGDMPKRVLRVIRKWAGENKKLLMDTWKAFHSIEVA